MYDLQEQEQIDALKAWWKENRRAVIFTVIAAVAGVAVVACVAAAAGVSLARSDRGARAP